MKYKISTKLAGLFTLVLLILSFQTPILGQSIPELETSISVDSIVRESPASYLVDYTFELQNVSGRTLEPLNMVLVLRDQFGDWDFEITELTSEGLPLDTLLYNGASNPYLFRANEELLEDSTGGSISLQVRISNGTSPGPFSLTLYIYEGNYMFESGDPEELSEVYSELAFSTDFGEAVDADSGSDGDSDGGDESDVDGGSDGSVDGESDGSVLGDSGTNDTGGGNGSILAATGSNLLISVVIGCTTMLITWLINTSYRE